MSTPPFRADHVGSLVRPPARARPGPVGPGSRPDPDEAEERAIAEAIRMQEDSGLPAVTDGAPSGPSSREAFLLALGGIEPGASGATTRPASPAVTGPLDVPDDHPCLAGFRRLASLARMVPKAVIPGPAELRGALEAGDILHGPYRDDPDALSEALTQVVAKTVLALHGAGCRYLQIDATGFGRLCKPGHRVAIQEAGEDPDTLAGRHARMIGEAIRGRPQDMVVALHVGALEDGSAGVTGTVAKAVAEAVFEGTGADVVLIDCDPWRAGSLEALRVVPAGRLRVLAGLVSARRPELERLDDLRRRMDEAARHVDLEQLGLAPDAGFVGPDGASALSFDDQRRKLDLIVRAAEAIWGRVDA